MSLGVPLTCVSPSRFPRVSGDEPTRYGAKADGGEFSPRERG